MVVAVDHDARTVRPGSDDNVDDDRTARSSSADERPTLRPGLDYRHEDPRTNRPRGVGESRVVIARGSELAISRGGDDTRIGPPVLASARPLTTTGRADLTVHAPSSAAPAPDDRRRIDHRRLDHPRLDHPRLDHRRIDPPLIDPTRIGPPRVDHTRIGPPAIPARAARPVDPRRTITTGEGDTWPAPPGGELSFRDRDSFGRFTILDTLGTGGMGVVLSAYDP